MRVNALLGLAALGLLLAPAAAEEKTKLEPDKLVGTWTYVSGVKNGTKMPADDLKKGTVIITKDTFTLKSEMGKFVMKYELDPAKTPCQIKIEITEGPQGVGAKTEGIIALDNDQLKLCYPPMGGDAPKEFSAKEGSGFHLFVLKKKK
jgi:uncharacterized protein (TIGR03067 family)